MRVYRDPAHRSLRNPLARSVLPALFPVVVAVGCVWTVWPDRLGTGIALAVTGALIAMTYRGHQTRCFEIHLDDEVCELHSERGIVRLHVNQITSVRLRHDGDGDPNYVIRYEGGRVSTGAMRDFDDFVARLRRLHPAIEVSGFPSDASPELGSITPPRTRGQLIRSALFPSIVVVVIGWLAIQTLTGS